MSKVWPSESEIERGLALKANDPKNNQPLCKGCLKREDCKIYLWQIAPMSYCDQRNPQVNAPVQVDGRIFEPAKSFRDFEHLEG